MNLDDLELELRRLPGIRWAAFTEFGDRLLVQLHAMHDAHSDLTLEASRIAGRHCDVPLAVDVVRWMTRPETDRSDLEHSTMQADGATAIAVASTPESVPGPGPEPPSRSAEVRPEVLAVVVPADTDEVEVHVGDGTTRTIGRAPMGRGLIGAADATLEAIRGGFTVEFPVAPEWARTIQTNTGARPVVAVALGRPGGGECYGLSCAASELEAAAHATLDALHRNVRVARRDDVS